MLVMVESRFLASATGPVAPVLVAVRVVPVEVALVELVDFPRAAVDLGVLVEEAGFRAAAVVDAVVPTALFSVALPGDAALPGVVEVRRAVPDTLEVNVRFLSSSDTDGRVRCEAVDEVAVAGRLATVEPAGGRVGGLLNPPVEVVVRADEPAVGFVPAVPEVAAVRRAVADDVVGVRLVALGDLVVLVAAADFGEGEAAAGFGAGEVVAGFGAGAGAAASSGWTTSKPSASDMLGYTSNAEYRSLVRWEIMNLQE